MKNKYLTKCLCITLISAMVLGSPLASYAAGETDYLSGEKEFLSEGEEEDIIGDSPEATPEPTQVPDTEPEPTQAPTVEPEPTQAPTVEPEPTQAPTVEPEPTVAPTESPEPTQAPSIEPTQSPDPTLEPTDPTPTPEDLIPESVRLLINRISAAASDTITLDMREEIEQLRADYNALSADEQLMVTNYHTLVDMENQLEALLDGISGEEEPGNNNSSDNGYTAQTGTAVYVTNMVSNLHAGKEFYLNTLQDNYQLSFSEDFADVMKSIEQEYKSKNRLMDTSDLQGGEVTTSADHLLVRNWQDILAVYVYEKSKEGQTSFELNEDCKDELAAVFAEMNPVVRDKQNITKVSYGNRNINYYIKKNKISKDDRAILKKYTETDCKLLCAVVTAADGFVRESVGDDVSEERVNVITAAYSLVGKVGYFWGGKSTTIGVDSSWGTVEKVTASGSNSSGTMRAYGLDCSGFVTWAVINGYKDQSMQSEIGDGTSNQWLNANTVSEADAQPGDLVFQRGPEAGSDNHVGILCGKTDAGDWIAVHCSSSKNGVTVGEAYGASFRYIRQPAFYPDQQEVAQMQESGLTETDSASVTSGESLIEVFSAPEETFSGNSGSEASGSTSDTLSDSGSVFSGASSSGSMTLPQSISIEMIDVDVFE